MRTGARATCAVLLSLALIAAAGGAATADRTDPLPSKAQVEKAEASVRAKARGVAAIRADLAVATATLEAAAQRAEIATEAYNAARWRLAEAKRATAAARAAAAKAERRVADQAAGIAALVTQSYQSGTDLVGMSALFGDAGPVDLMNRVGVVESVGSALEARYSEYAAADVLAEVARKRALAAEKKQAAEAESAATLRTEAAAAEARASEQAAAIAQQRNALIADLAKAQRISVSLARQRQEGLEEVARERAAAAAAAAAAQAAQEAADKAAQEAADKAAQNEAEEVSGSGGGQAGAGSGTPTGGGLPSSVGTSAGAERALAFARAQLGEPYMWAAAGPDAWDCSGLTMRAWEQGGVNLPHYSAAQYQQTRHIGVNELRPGDLVFWGDSPVTIHHVALYLGDGKIIHAPRTGEPVQIASMYYWIPPTYFGRP